MPTGATLNEHQRRAMLWLLESEHTTPAPRPRTLHGLRRRGLVELDKLELTGAGRFEAQRLHEYVTRRTTATMGWPPMNDNPDRACADVHGWSFFSVGATAERAKDMCRLCPILQECYDFAIPIYDLYGIWGGTTRFEREQIRAGLRESPDWAVAA